MEQTPIPESKLSKALKLFLKIAVTGVCLWYVSGKIDFSKAGAALKTANWFYLFIALVAFVVSKLFSAVRLNLYFRNIGIRLDERTNIRLYWMGMYYNLFLPGSIGGDAYKVILLTRKYDIPFKKTTAAVLLDRFSGLLGLILLLAVYAAVVLKASWLTAAAISSAIIATVLMWAVVKYWLKDFISSFVRTLCWGIGVQAMQVICAYLLMSALGIPFHETGYIFLFLISSMVAVLPLTIGGLGARELVFLKGSAWLGLIQERSVVISLLFYLVTLLTSAFGILYVFRNPLEEAATRSDGKGKS